MNRKLGVAIAIVATASTASHSGAFIGEPPRFTFSGDGWKLTLGGTHAEYVSVLSTHYREVWTAYCFDFSESDGALVSAGTFMRDHAGGAGFADASYLPFKLELR